MPGMLFVTLLRKVTLLWTISLILFVARLLGLHSGVTMSAFVQVLLVSSIMVWLMAPLIGRGYQVVIGRRTRFLNSGAFCAHVTGQVPGKK